MMGENQLHIFFTKPARYICKLGSKLPPLTLDKEPQIINIVNQNLHSLMRMQVLLAGDFFNSPFPYVFMNKFLIPLLKFYFLSFCPLPINTLSILSFESTDFYIIYRIFLRFSKKPKKLPSLFA